MGFWSRINVFKGSKTPPCEPPSTEHPEAESPAAAGPLTACSPEEVLKKEGYHFHRKIGKGGYGTVWMAVPPGGSLCALKIVQANKDDRKAFDREREAVARIGKMRRKSDLLVPVDRVEVHEEHGFLSYAMPLAEDVTGCPVSVHKHYEPRTLESELKSRGRLPVAECVEVGKRVLGALQDLHDQGLIHRDIKASNVIYVKGQPVVADFGLVTCEGPDVSQVASPSNMPAEGVGAAEADLYAVAVLLYRLATGQPPEHFPSVGNGIRDPLFPRLNRVITRAGERSPAQRYANARAMELALDWVLEVQDGSSGQSSDEDLGRLVRRHVRKEAIDRIVPPPALRKAMGCLRAHFEAHVAESLAAEDSSRSTPTSEAFADAAAAVALEFERRIGRPHALVTSAGLIAQAVFTPDARVREELFVQAAEEGGCQSGIGRVVVGAGTALGWGRASVRAAITWLYRRHATTPRDWWNEDAMIPVMAVVLSLRLKSPENRFALASQVLLEGMEGAMLALWDEYGDLLSTL